MIRGLIILLNICGGFSQIGIFNIGFLNQNYLNYVSGVIPESPSLNLTLVPVPPTLYTTISAFGTTQTQFQYYHVIIGAFDYSVATVCQSISLAYFIVDEQLDRTSNSNALLDSSVSVRLMGGALAYILQKYGWMSNLKFISDSSPNAMSVLFSLSDQPMPMCNFQPNDTSTTVANCFQSLNFVVTPGAAYVIVTDDNNTALLDTIFMQLAFRSLPYQSFMFLPMLYTKPTMIKYHYTGGPIYAIKKTLNDSETIYTLVNTYAFQALTFVNSTINSRNLSSTITPAVMLQNLLRAGVYKSTGEQQVQLFYWTVLQNMTSTNTQIVSNITYNSIYSLPSNIADPTNLAAIDVIRTIYVADPVYATDVNSPDATISVNGFVSESLPALLTSINLVYVTIAANGTNITGRYNYTTSTYTGMLANMFNNLTDMTAFPVPIIPSYLNRFYYSEKIYDISYSILMIKQNKTTDFARMAKPFSILVWLSIIITIVFLSLILWLTNFISPNIASSTERLTLSNSIFLVFGSFLIAKMLVKPNMISTQIFYLIIWLGTLLLIASYVANLSVTLAFQTALYIDFTTIPNLLNQATIKYVFLKDSILYNQIMNDLETGNNRSIYVQLYQNASINWNNIYLLNSTINIPDFLFRNPTAALVNDQYHNLYYSLRNCSLITLSDSTSNVSVAYMLQPGFKYKTQLQQQIITMKLSGQLDFLANKYFFVGTCPTTISVVTSVLSLSVQDMAGVFLMIVIGIVIAFPVAVLEYFLDKSKLQCQRNLTGNSLRFGQIYSAKVIALDRNGVTIDIGRLNMFSSNNEGRIYYVPKKYLGIKRKGVREILAPTDQGIMIGTKLLMKYMGNNPVDSKRIFVQVQKKK